MTRKFYPLAMILTILVLVFSAFPNPATADHMGDWGYIKISPLSGHWNYPGYFVLEAERTVTVSWEIKCSYVPCGRDMEFGSHTFTFVGEKIEVGWGHQCYAWQFDPIGRTGFIAEAEPWLCEDPTPIPTGTAAQDTPTTIPGTPCVTPDTPTPTGTQGTPGAPGDTPDTPTPTAETSIGTPTNTPVGTNLTPTPTTAPGESEPTPTLTLPQTTPDTPTPSPTPEVVLPVTGETPPASPLSSPLWPALASLLLLGLAGRLVWVGILQSNNVQIPANLNPDLRIRARKALILILLSLLILAFLVLPPIIRQAAYDFGGPASYAPQSQALVQELPPNFH
jgi:hypothetical protein